MNSINSISKQTKRTIQPDQSILPLHRRQEVLPYLRLLLLPVLFFASCASIQPNLTQEQRLYSAFIDYTVIGGLAANYCESPNADPDVKAKIKMADKWIFEKLTALKSDMDAGLDIGDGLYLAGQLLETLKGLVP